MTENRDNLNPHREAILAMMVWHNEYAAQRGGVMDFWRKLPISKKTQCIEWCNRLEATERGGF